MAIPFDASARWIEVKVAFRADASIQIGTGHVLRCLTLANELTRQGHECWFVCREHPGNLNDLVASHGHTFLPLQAPEVDPSQIAQSDDDYAHWLGVPWQADVRQTLNIITPLKPDCLVVDHYALDSRWERTMSGVVGKIMVVDDLANRPHVCSVLLDQNLGRVASDYDGLLPAESQKLIGPDFALLRPEFAAIRDQSLQRRKNAELKRILVSLGGVDHNNITSLVLESLKVSPLPQSTELDIVMGVNSPHLDDVRNRANDLPFRTTVSVNVKNMAERMHQADLSIGAAGGTSWERACLGLPAVLVVLEANQYASAKALEIAGAAILIGGTEAEILRMPKIFANVLKLDRLKQMSKSASTITNGCGAERVARRLIAAGRSEI